MKTYCISDVHGHIKNFKAFKHTLNSDDRVYVLGDVIDKGESSIELLLEIMEDDRFTMLLGNHEYMMWQFLSAKRNTLDYNVCYDAWIKYNQGHQTMSEYIKLSKDDKKRIYDYITNMPINLSDVVVNDKHFYLVHAFPSVFEEYSLATIDNEELIVDFIWSRIDPTVEHEYIKDKTVVAGHTPVFHFGTQAKPVFDTKDIKDAHYIDIDGGLAANLPASKLVVLCLNDLTYRIF